MNDTSPIGATRWGRRGTAGRTIPKSLVFEAVRLAFGGLVVLDGVDLAVAAGEVVALLGPSGCGKTTLLRVAAGMERPSTGRVLLDGREVAGPSRFLEAEERGVGLVFQDYALFPHMSVLDNVRFGLRDLSRADTTATALRALERVGLADFADAHPHMLSGGEQQRVALARAVAPRPGVLLMDEPFSNLDQRMRNRVRDETIALVRETGATVVIVTHDPEEAMRVADRIALMRAGRIVQVGTAEALWRTPASLFAARFFSDFVEIEGRVSGGVVATPFGRFAAPGLAEGEGAVVCVRPQGVRLVRTGEGCLGRVVERRFLGVQDLVSVVVEGLDVPAQARMRGGTGPAPGTDVGVVVAPEDVLVFAAGAA